VEGPPGGRVTAALRRSDGGGGDVTAHSAAPSRVAPLKNERLCFTTTISHQKRFRSVGKETNGNKFW
jgi:hypothetical protein